MKNTTRTTEPPRRALNKPVIRTTSPAGGLDVEHFNVVTPWIRVAIPIKAGPHAYLTAQTPLVHEQLGRCVYTAAIGPHRTARDGERDVRFELELVGAEFHLAPARTSRTRCLLHLEMQVSWWSMIEDLAAFYGTTPLAIVHAGLAERIQSLRNFHRHHATGSGDPDVTPTSTPLAR